MSDDAVKVLAKAVRDQKQAEREARKKELATQSAAATVAIQRIAPIIGDYYQLRDYAEPANWMCAMKFRPQERYWARDLVVWFLVTQFKIPVRAIKMATGIPKPGRGAANVQNRIGSVPGMEWFVQVVTKKINAANEAK